MFSVDNFSLNPLFLSSISDYQNLQSPPLTDLFFQVDDIHTQTTTGTGTGNNLHQTRAILSLELKPISAAYTIAATSGNDS